MRDSAFDVLGRKHERRTLITLIRKTRDKLVFIKDPSISKELVPKIHNLFINHRDHVRQKSPQDLLALDIDHLSFLHTIDPSHLEDSDLDLATTIRSTIITLLESERVDEKSRTSIVTCWRNTVLKEPILEKNERRRGS